jgi:hypothetical protein
VALAQGAQGTGAAGRPMTGGDKITVADGQGGSVQATVIAIWIRGNTRLTAHQAGSSSGPGAFTFQLGARYLFDKTAAARVMLIATRAPMMLYLLEIGGDWFDVTGGPAICSEWLTR